VYPEALTIQPRASGTNRNVWSCLFHTAHTLSNTHHKNLIAKHSTMTTSTSNDSLLQQLGPDLELWSPSQNTHAKAQDVLANKIVLIYFSASWCPRK